MLRINRIKAVSKTESGEFGFDHPLADGLNLIASNKNTCGKSSVLLVIYYCLGFEQIVGGIGHKVLTSVFKSSVTDSDGCTYDVLESELYLEITNGTDVVTIYRTGKMAGRNDNLVSVYFNSLDTMFSPDTYVEDMYVHSQNSATSSKGFHAFLERFLSLDLPLVPASNGAEYKLYIQLLFSCIFIEQKRGWSDLFSAMPVLGISDAKKRVIEYILALDTLANEKKKNLLKQQELSIQSRWEVITSDIVNSCNRDDCRIAKVPGHPKILDLDFADQISIVPYGQDALPLNVKIVALQKEYDSLKTIKPRVIDNFDDLQSELLVTEESIRILEEQINTYRHRLVSETQSISKLQESYDVILADIRNNKDALKLRNMGSELHICSFQGICPLCNQHIEDTLLPTQNATQVMTIEDNIRHLESQRDMISFAISAHRKNKKLVDENAQAILGKLYTLRRLAKAIRTDLFSVDEEISEAVVLKRIQIENRIEALTKLKDYVDSKLLDLHKLSLEWKEYLEVKAKLPKIRLSTDDIGKLDFLEHQFKNNLKEFRYISVSDFNSVQISKDNYLPISEGFDMKFDSSASDSIRAIWAYTIALMQVSIAKKGSHPSIIMFDEPAQHSIVTEDVMSLIKTTVSITGKNQVIFGITLNDSNIRTEIASIDNELVNIIDIGDRAFKRILPN